jgi:hypothetical protein
MRMWLRLTSLFGPPDDYAARDNIVCASIGAILRADALELVHAPMPAHFANLLRKIAEAEREQSLREVSVSDTAGLIAAVSGRIPTAPLQSGEARPV